MKSCIKQLRITSQQTSRMKPRIILYLWSLWAMEGHGAFPVLLPPSVTGQEGENACSSRAAAEAQFGGISKEEIKQIINDKVNPQLNSCGSILWTRVAHLDMRDPGSVCPTNWTLHTSPVRGCGQTQTAGFTCDPAFFSSQGQNYSRVCGRILAYHKGTPDAFWNSVSNGVTSIESAYVDGISLTHGPEGSRQHIWTFTASPYGENPTYMRNVNCKCTNTRYSWPYQLPSFIQDNYFCDTGNPGPGFDLDTYYSDDPLWDGAGCGEDSTCCKLNNPPWFYSSLPQATTDDLEVRLCFSDSSPDEDVIVYLLEVFVQQ